MVIYLLPFQFFSSILLPGQEKQNSYFDRNIERQLEFYLFILSSHDMTDTKISQNDRTHRQKLK